MCVCERERGREGGRYRPNIGGIMCVCVREREGGKEGGTDLT